MIETTDQSPSKSEGGVAFLNLADQQLEFSNRVESASAHGHILLYKLSVCRTPTTSATEADTMNSCTARCYTRSFDAVTTANCTQPLSRCSQSDVCCHSICLLYSSVQASVLRALQTIDFFLKNNLRALGRWPIGIFRNYRNAETRNKNSRRSKIIARRTALKHLVLDLRRIVSVCISVAWKYPMGTTNSRPIVIWVFTRLFRRVHACSQVQAFIWDHPVLPATHENRAPLLRSLLQQSVTV
jgi:hypothetical protein